MAQETKQPNIWWINQFALPTSQPGGGRHVQLARALAKQGCTTTIVASSTNYMTGLEVEPEEMRALDFVPIPIGWRGPRGIGKLLRMRSFGKKVSSGNWIGNRQKPDVIIGSSPSLQAANAAATLAQQFNVPFIVEVRDIWPLSLVEVAGVSPKHPIVRHLYKLEERVIRRAARVISLLPQAGNYFSKYGTKADTIDWIPNGVDMEMFPEVESTSTEGTTVLYVGSLGPPNGMLTILDAAKMLQATHPSIQFRIIGDGSAKEKLKLYARSKNMTTVSFEPAISREKVPAELANADILVANVPSHDLYKYGISLNKLYEYLASGKPIALATSAADDPVTVAGVGPVVPADDAGALAKRIAVLATMTHEEREELGIKGRRFVQENNMFDLLAERVLSSVQKALRS
jgi:glycosyltransferase involved in cell wall biosynthesis